MRKSKALEALDRIDDILFNSHAYDSLDDEYSIIEKELKQIEKLKEILKRAWNGYNAVDLIDAINEELFNDGV